jgi:Cof subfamily protein (haloacid dehalogenase superfamily)
MNKDLSKVILISDVDRTFITHDKQYISRNMEAIEQFKACGGKFTLATGRVIQAAEHFIDDNFINFPLILGNGCMIYDAETCEVLKSYYLTDEVIPVIHDFADSFPDISVELNTPDGIIVCRMTDYERRHILAARFKSFSEMPLDSALKSQKLVKTLFAGSPESIAKLEEYCKSRDYSCAEFVRSDPIFYEILPKNCSKGSALQEMREILGLENYTIIAMGDFFNDLEMLEAADFAACPADAAPEIQAICDYVCESGYEDGAVGEVIEKLFDKSLDIPLK